MVSTTLLIDFRDITFDSLDGNSHFCPCTHSLILAAGAGTPIANEAVAIWEAVKEQVNANQTEIKRVFVVLWLLCRDLNGYKIKLADFFLRFQKGLYHLF